MFFFFHGYKLPLELFGAKFYDGRFNLVIKNWYFDFIIIIIFYIYYINLLNKYLLNKYI